jgi:hypothetical protein
MSRSIFDNKSIKPDDDNLFKTLGASGKYWRDLKQHFEKEYGALTEEWKFYSQKSGWILKVFRSKRNLFFFTPLKGYFRITFVFGDKAVTVIEESDLPKKIIDSLRNAQKYVEGRSIQIDVKLPKDLKNVKKLVEIKVKN